MSINIIPPRIPLVDPRTGLINQAWFLFFKSGNTVLYSTTNITTTINATISALTTRIQVLEQEVADLNTYAVTINKPE